MNLRARPYLPAGNFRARICLAEALVSSFKSAGLLLKGAYFFVTLIPDGFTTASRREGAWLEELRVWTEGALAGLSYVAAIDVGAYISLAFQPGRRDTLFSWHIHAIVWRQDQRCCPEAYVHGLVHGLNMSTIPLLPGFLPAHYRKISYDVCLKRLLYSVKFPISEFQAWPTASTGQNDQLRPTPPQWNQRPKPIRPGTAARIASQLAAYSLDKIVFGDGQGHHIVAAALDKARAEMALAEERRMTLLYEP